MKDLLFAFAIACVFAAQDPFHLKLARPVGVEIRIAEAGRRFIMWDDPQRMLSQMDHFPSGNSVRTDLAKRLGPRLSNFLPPRAAARALKGDAR